MKEFNFIFKLNTKSIRRFSILFLFLTVASSLFTTNTFGQACDGNVPSDSVDLTGNPSATWISSSGVRKGVCCGANPNPPDNDRCVEFWVTLDPGAEGLNFDIATGAVPGGTMFYQISTFPDYTVCGTPKAVGSPICLPDVSHPIRITFCKPGNNPNSYKITSIAKPSVDGLVTVSDGCTSIIKTTGFQPATITWKSISPGVVGQWNGRLSCTAGCASTTATYAVGAPSSVTYEVCGTPIGGCTGATICLTTTVNFVSTLAVNITPINPTICFGGASTPLTANGTGGAPPYIYTWSTGANTQVINASAPGVYSVTVRDGTSCPAANASVTVTAYALPILANAGPDKTSCANNSKAVLQGSVQAATGGIWSGGAGTYSPSNTSLTPTYTPTAAEIAFGSVTHTLTTTGNGSCPSASDAMVLTIVPTPIVNANVNQTVCGNNATTTLAGSVLNASGGRWSGGTGTYFPNDSTLNALYTPSAAEITAGTVTLTLTSIGNGTCLPVTDQMIITITAAPTSDAGPDQTKCGNNAVTTLAGAVTNAPTRTWSGGAGSFSNVNSLTSTYTPTAAEITAGTVTLTLTASKPTCNSVTDQMTITLTPAPTVNAGPDRAVCRNNATVILNGSVTVATGGTWSGGTGTFSPDANTLNATYTPSAAEITAGTVTLTLTTTGNGLCNAVTDQMTITMSATPTVNANIDRTVCGNNPNVVLNGSVTVATGGTWSGGTGTFSPDANTLNATYTPSAAEITAGTATLTLTTTGNGLCNPVSDQMTITITPAPTVNAGLDRTVCGNNPALVLSGSVTIATGGTWSGGTGTFSPDANTLNATYTPSAAEITAGTTTLTLTTTGNGLCNAVADQMTITITPAPTVNAGIDRTVCKNNAGVTLAGSVTVATGGTWSGGSGTFTPNASTLNATYTPSAAELTAGTATLILTTTGNGTCLAVADQMTITVTPPPTVDAGFDITSCANNPNGTLNGSITIATGGIWSGGCGSFSPNTTTLTGVVYTPCAAEITAGVAALVLTTTGNGNCIAVTDTVLVIITPAPTANAGLDRTVCANSPSLTLAGAVTNNTGFNWSGGGGTFNPNNLTLNAIYTPSAAEITTGTVTLTLTSTRATCNPVTDQMTITITPPPTVNAGADRTVCGNNASLTLNGSVTVATGGTWSGGTGTFNPNANTLNAVYTPSAAEITAGTATLTLTTTGNGTCLAVTDQMTITITPAPTSNANINQTVCGNNATVTLNGSVTIATGGTWSGGTGTFNPNASTLNAIYTPSAAEITAGTVTLTLTTTGNGTCLAVTDQMTITITPAPTVSAGPDQPICANNATAVLNGVITVATGGVWTGGGGVFNPNNTTLNASYAPSPAEVTAGTVTLTLTSTGNGSCNQVSDNIIITITPAPTISAGPDQTACAGTASVPLNGTVTISTGGNWTTAGTGSFSPNSATLNGSYVPSAADRTAGSVVLTLTTTGNGNCTPLTDNMTITFTAVPSVDAGPNATVCTNDFPVQLSGSGSPSTWSGGTGIFTPNTGALNATYVPSAAEITAGTVTLTLTTNPSGACTPIADNVTITLPPGPIVNANIDQTVCGDVANISLNGSVANAGGGQWTTNGSGIFTPSATNLNATYNPSAADIAFGGATLTLTSTINGACSPVTDQMILTITPAPTISAGPDQTVCGDIATIPLNGSVTVATGAIWSGGGGGVFTPNNTTLNATYTPTAAERLAGTVTLTLSSTGNGTCNQVSDNITITITPGPTVNAGLDQTICADLASTPLNGSFTVATGVSWSSNGTGTFSPNNTTSNASYFPSAADTVAGIVTLTLSTTGNGTCNPVTDQMTITINPKPIVKAGPDQTNCADIISAPLNGSVFHAGGGTWTTNGTGTFTPNNTTLNASYNPSAADKTGGVVTLTLTSSGNGTCNTVTDQMVINFTVAPTINAGLDQSICADAASATLSATVTIATGGTWVSNGTGTFSNANILNPTYSPSAADTTAGTVTLTVTSTGNGTCNPVTDNVIITITPIPTVNANVNQTVCGDIAGVTLNGSVTIATGGIWSGGAGTFSPNANTLNASYIPSAAERLGSSVTLTLTTTGNGTCNPVTDQMTITITPAPVINAGPDQIVCGDIASVNLNGSVTIGGVTTGGTWTTLGTGVIAVPNNLSTTYTPSATDISNGVVVLTLTSTGNGTCNAVTDNLTITITPTPTVNAGPDRTICADQSSLVLSGTATVATGGQWSSAGSGTFTPNANTLNANYFPSAADTTAHTVTLTLTTTGNGTCNPVTDQMVITITPAPVVNAGANQTICADLNSVALTGAYVVNASGGTWTSNGTGSFTPNSTTLPTTYIPSAFDKAAGNVTLTLTSTGNGTCNAVSDQMLIMITPAPTVNAGPDQSVCATTGGVSLNGSVTVATGGIWTTGSGAGSFVPDNTTLNATFIPAASQIAAGQANLRLTTTGNGTCNSVLDNLVITITPTPIVTTGPNQTVCASVATVTFNGTVTNATGGTWTTNGTGTFNNANALTTIYTPSAADKIAGSIILTLTSTGNGSCAAVSRNVALGFTPVPTVDAGAPAMCATAAGVQLSGTVTNATGGTWSSTGSGTFTASANILNPIYTPSAADQLAGSVKLYFSSTGSGPCAAARDSISLGIQPNPTANAGPDQIVCADAGTITLAGSTTNSGGGTWTSSGGGPFAPDATTMAAVYTLSAADIVSGSATLTLTTTGNGFCNAASDQMTILITPAPTISAGPDQTLCQDVAAINLNGSVTIATGGIWSSAGTGTFNPNANTLNATYIPSAADTTAGSVKLALTSTGNGTCNAVSDTMVITFTPGPTVTALSDLTVCSDVSVIAYTAEFTVATGVTWSSTGSGTFDNPNLTTSQYTISAADKTAGLVKIISTTTGNGTCNPVKDTVDLVIINPTIDAGPATACQNGGAVPLNATVTVATGVIWSSNGDGVFADPTALVTTYTIGANDIANGSAILTITSTGNGICNPVTDSILLNIATAPNALANIDQTVCADIALISLNGSQLNAGGTIWSTPDGTGSFGNPNNAATTYNPSNADTTAGQVTFILTTTGGNPLCVADTDTMIVTLTPAPTINAGPANVCSNAPPVVLNGSATVATGFQWSTAGDGSFSAPTSLSTNFTPGPNDIINGSVNLVLTSTAQGTCNPVSDNILLIIAPSPTANAGNDTSVCADIVNATGIPIQGSVGVPQATGGAWTSSGSGTFADDSSLATTYTLSAADTTAGSVTLTLTTIGTGACNPVSDTKVITILPTPIVNAGPNQSVCGDVVNINLSGTVVNATGGTWSTPNGTGGFGAANSLNTTYSPTAADTTAGTVTFVLTSTGIGSCNIVRDTMILTITDAPRVDAGPAFICSDAVSIPFSGTKTVATGVQWSSTGTGSFAPNNISLNTNYIPSAGDRLAGSVIITLTTTGNGTCNPVSDNVTLFLTPPPTVNAGADQGVCADAGTINLTGSVTNAGGGTWTTLGSGGFLDANALNTTYTMSNADTTAHTVTLILTTTGTAPCNPVSDTVVISITPAPVAVVNAGNDTTVCADNTDIPLNGIIANAAGGTWTSNGSGVFSPNAFTLNATYFPSANDITTGTVTLTLTSTGNGICNPIIDNMIVTITPEPTANAGIDDTVCADVGGVPLNGIITTATTAFWITSGTGTFNPNANTLNATYIPSDADTTDREVILTLQTIDNGACSPAIDNKRLTITPAPTVDAGFDQTVCADALSITLNGTVTTATGIEWTTSGTGIFSDSSLLNPTYTLSAADTASGSVILTITTTGNGTCNPVSDNVVLTISTAPTIFAGLDQTICADAPSISLNGLITVASGGIWTTTGTGTFAPNDVALNASYFTTAADTTAGTVTFVLTSTGNGSCNTVTDTMIATIDPAPVVDAGPDQTVCADVANVGLNGTVVNASGGAWTTSGTGAFADDSLLVTTYVPSNADTTAGIIILNLKSTGNGFCNPVTDNMRIDITPAPVVNAGPDQTICADAASVTLSGSITVASGAVWTSTGTGTFADDSSLTTTYTPSAADTAAGTVTFTLTTTGNGTCNPASDNMVLTISNAPTVNAGPDRTICGDAVNVVINGSVTTATGGVWSTAGTGTFAPNANTLIVTYTPSAADRASGLVGLTLTTTGNGTCNAVSNGMNLRITTIPTVSAGPDQTICADAVSVQLAGSKTISTGVTWTTSGSGTFTPVAANTLNATYTPSAADKTAGIVNLTITTSGNGTCNPVTDNMRITITPAPTVNAGPDETVCADAISASLNATATVATGGVWTTTGTGSFSPNPDGLSRSYTLSPGDTTLGTVTFTVTTTGNGTCNAVTDNKIVTITPAPIVTTGGSSICSDVTGANLSGAVFNATGGIWSTAGSGTFSPNNATLNARYNPSAADIAAGFTVLTLTSSGNGTCNPVTANMNLTITPLPVADAGPDQNICRGSSTFIVARSIPNVTYTWFTTTGVNIGNSGIVNVTANTDTSFVLTVTDSKGCSVNDTIDVFVVDPPSFNLANNYCFTFGLPLNSDPSFAPSVGTFQWYRDDALLFGENDSLIVIDQIGTYMIGYNFGSCSVFDTTQVTPLPVLNGLDKFTCVGSQTIINTSNIVGATYTWNPAAANNDSITVTASVIPFDTNTYIVTVTNTLNCQNNDTILVMSVPPPNITLTNIPSCVGNIATLNATPSNINDTINSRYIWSRDGAILSDTTDSITVNTSGTYSVIYSLGECMAFDTSVVTFFPLPIPNNLSEVKYCDESDISVVLDAGTGTQYQWLNTINPPADTFQTVSVDAPGIYYVTIYNQFNCFVTDSIEAKDVCPPRFFISNAFTPGDSKNNTFDVFGAYFKNFKMTIFNRWGEIIFYSEDKKYTWDGNYRNEPMPPGVYPYIITYEGEHEDYKGPFQVTGSVTVIR